MGPAQACFGRVWEQVKVDTSFEVKKIINILQEDQS